MGDTQKTIGIIGFGNMGQAIAEQLKGDYQICVFDKDELKTKDLKSTIKVVLETALVVQNCDVIILAVKPQDFESLLTLIKKSAAGTDKLYISIAAGITTGYIEKTLSNARVIRAMPNMLIKIGASVTCLSKGKFATDQDLEFAGNLFGHMGETLTIKEEMMNAATAISGSGPGYYFNAVVSNKQEFVENRKKFHEDFITELKTAAENLGFDSKTAYFLANWTIVYSDLLLKETKLPPEELRKQVASKGGTTEAALEVLHNGGSLVDAVKAAVKRAQELSK